MTMRVSLIAITMVTHGLFAVTAMPGFADDTIEDKVEATFLDILGTSGEADAFNIDTSVPDYAATALLGDGTSSFTNVTTPEDFGAQLLGVFGSSGNLKPGVAIAGSPYWLLGNRPESLSDYQADGAEFARILKRTQVSFAIVPLSNSETSSGSSGAVASLGVATELLDSADPRYDLKDGDCLRKALTVEFLGTESLKAEDKLRVEAFRLAKSKFANDPVVSPYVSRLITDGDFPEDSIDENWGILGELSDIDQSKYDEVANFVTTSLDTLLIQQNRKQDADDRKAFQKAVSACEKSAAERLQRKASLRVGAAIAARSESGEQDDLEDAGTAIWLSFRSPLGNTDEAGKSDGTLSSWGAFAKYETDATEAVEMSEMTDMTDGMMSEAEEDMMLAKYDGWRAGLNVNRVKDDFVVSGALSYVEKDFKSDMMEDEDYILATLTASMKISDGFWAEASFGWADDAQFDAQEFAGIRLKADWSKLGLN